MLNQFLKIEKLTKDVTKKLLYSFGLVKSKKASTLNLILAFLTL